MAAKVSVRCGLCVYTVVWRVVNYYFSLVGVCSEVRVYETGMKNLKADLKTYGASKVVKNKGC